MRRYCRSREWVGVSFDKEIKEGSVIEEREVRCASSLPNQLKSHLLRTTTS
jgi:hypothetical protein